MSDANWQNVMSEFAASNPTGVRLRDTDFRKRADPSNALEAIDEAAAHHAK